MKRLLFGIALGLMAVQVAGQPRLPNKDEITGFKKLAAQSVDHVEASLKKIERGVFLADAGKVRDEVTAPAVALLKDWKKSGLSDAVLMSYSACQNILGDIQVYGNESIKPPHYQLSDAALQKLKFISDDLADCRTLRKQTPDFHFARQ